MKRILGILLVLITVSPCIAENYYVSTIGDDSSVGNSTSPWKTIQKCINTINAGDSCIIKNGSYTESLVSITRSGLPSYPLSILAEDRRQVVLNGNVDITGSYVRINALRIVPQSSSKFGIDIKGNYNEVTDCYIDGNKNILGPNNIACNITGQFNKLVNSYISGTCFGVIIGGQNNSIINNEVYALKLNGNCGDVDYTRFFGSGHIFKSNKLHGIDKTQVGTSHVDCFQTFDNGGPTKSAQNILIEGNFCDGASQGMMMQASTYNNSYNITVRNNVFKNLNAWGMCVHQIKKVKIYNNTFDITGGIHGVGCRYGASCEIKNNIFYNGSLYWFSADSTIIDGTTTAPGKNNVLYKEGVNITGYANDKINIDPLFVDRINNNYRLLASSPAIGYGVVISDWSNATDKDGNIRQGAWDVGAYQSTATTSAPATTTTSTSTPTTTTTSKKTTKTAPPGKSKRRW